MDATLAEFGPAVALVGQAARWAAGFAERLRSVGATSKSDASPVTAADLALQALLVAGLQERYGAIPVVGEESTAVFRGEGGDALRSRVHELAQSARPGFTSAAIDAAIDAGTADGTSREQWIIDPIDGTRGYLTGQQYCVCLGLVRDRDVAFGAAGCPRLGTEGLVVAASRGRGSWVWSGLAGGAPPHRVVAVKAPRPELVACESADVGPRAKQRLRLLAEAWPATLSARQLESQCKFVLVAIGEADLAVRFPPRVAGSERDAVWDYAGAVVMAEEAGARMTDCDGQPLRFGRGRYIEGNRGILCAAPWLHATAVERMPEVDRLMLRATPQASSDG